MGFDIEPATVFILADRSGSEFDTATTGEYFTFRTAILQAISDLQADTYTRLGFGSYVGDHASGTCMPVYDSVPIALNNGTAIATKYNSLGPLLPFLTAKDDGPASAIIPMVKAALQADAGTGGKYMLFATDGNTDFCDDGNMVCPPDAVTYLIQDMKTAGIGTVMLGVATTIDAFSASALQNFANAGVGLPVALPMGITSPSGIYFQCTSVTAWHGLWASVGRTANNPIATYASTGGTATVYGSSASSTLLDQTKAAITSTKSCSFRISGNLRVDLTKLASDQVTISGTAIPQDAANGWSMTSDTELVLNGAACTAWRTPTATIAFQFPCDAILVP